MDASINPLPNIRHDVLEAGEYYEQLLTRIPKAKKRIVLAAMAVLWGEKTGRILDEISKAQERGVKVHILLDVFTKMGLGFPEGRTVFKNQLQKTLALVEGLQKKGARVDMVGKIGLNPFKGRCHIKITVVDDDCFSFGGVNFVDKAFRNHDYMLHAKNADLADCLSQLVERIGRAHVALPDGEVPVGEKTMILFDGGRPRQSVIYEHALALTRQAERVWYVSQMAPSGALGRALQATDATCYFNRPEQIIEAPARWAQAFDQQRYRTINNYHGTDYIHAKFMLFELFDGSKALISGSNNFAWRGVAFGTQEIALYSTDKQLWQQLFDFTKQHVVRK